MTWLINSLRRDRRGLTTLEFGFVALPLCLTLFASVEIGMAVRAKSALQYAAAQAARCAVVDKITCSTDTATQTYAVARSSGVAPGTSTFTVATATCGKLVTASLPFPVVAHKVIPAGLSLTARSCYPA